MNQVLATFIGGRLAVFDPAAVDCSPSQRALAIVERQDDQGRALVIDQAQKNNHRAVPVINAEPLAEIARLLARAAKIAKTLDDADRRRARELFSASNSLLAATTYLSERDQSLLNAALREA